MKIYNSIERSLINVDIGYDALKIGHLHIRIPEVGIPLYHWNSFHTVTPIRHIFGDYLYQGVRGKW